MGAINESVFSSVIFMIITFYADKVISTTNEKDVDSEWEYESNLP